MNRKLVPLAVLSLALVASLVVAPAVRAGTYVDTKHGFTIKIAPGWSQTPTQPGERLEVAKFKDDRKGDFSTLSIYRFVQAGTATETPDAAEAPEAPPSFAPGLPENAKEFIDQRIRPLAERYGAPLGELGKPRKIKLGKAEGEYYEFEWEAKRRRGMGRSYCVGIARQEGEEYLILYTSPLNQAKKLKRVARWSISSFRFKGDTTPAEDDTEKRGRALADEKDLLDPEKRARVKKELVGTWKYFDTPNYIIIYNCNYLLARVIADRIEWIRKNAFEKVFPPVEPIKEAMVVRICKEMDEYHHYGGPRGTGGYWAAGRDEFVLPDLAAKKKADKKTLGVLHHEGFHQYIHYALLRHDPPVWFNEGFAEYFYCARPAGRTKVAYEKKHDMRYGTFKNLLGTGGLIPIKDFVRLTHQQYMQRAQACYTEGWALSTWMMRVTRNERYRQVPDIYCRELQKGYIEKAEPGIPLLPGAGGTLNEVEENALDKAFEGIDLDKMHRDFLKDAKQRM